MLAAEKEEGSDAEEDVEVWKDSGLNCLVVLGFWRRWAGQGRDVVGGGGQKPAVVWPVGRLGLVWWIVGKTQKQRERVGPWEADGDRCEERVRMGREI